MLNRRALNAGCGGPAIDAGGERDVTNVNSLSLVGKLPELRDQARGRWKSILLRLGLSQVLLDGKQHPCPACGGKDRWRFTDKDGDGLSICNQCGCLNGAELAMHVTGMNFADMAARVRELLPEATFAPSKPARDDEMCKGAMREVWARSTPIAGTMAEAYLLSRGLSPPWPIHLRFVDHLRATKADEGFLPAMIARVTGPFGEGVNVHRTFLKDGARAYRAMMPGSVPTGSAIRLSERATHMGIAEGIETALRASLRFNVPVWAAIDADKMHQWEPPADVECVEIFGDHDRSFTGQAVSFGMARRLTNRKTPIKCIVRIPGIETQQAMVGKDWADD